MSKYRVKFKSSRLLLVMRLVTYAVLVLSVLHWQPNIIQYQFLLQILIVLIMTFFVLNVILGSRRKKRGTVIFSSRGEWLESNSNGQVGWKVTDKSRVSSFLLFIHLVSPLNARHSKWCLICKDQVTERDFRRLCRTVIFQQQTTGEIDI